MVPLRIAQVAPPLERVPPEGYGGTERVIAELVGELARRGHDVTLFASGDSEVSARLVPTVPRALWPAGFRGDAGGYVVGTALDVLRRADAFDIIHSHLEWHGILLARLSATPTVLTFHGRLDLDFAGAALADARGALVAISDSQARQQPGARWSAIVHNGLSLERAPFATERGEDLCFVGRLAPEKGVAEAIEIARRAGRKLRIAAKVPTLPSEYEYYTEVFLRALRGSDAEYLGELKTHERDELFAASYASLLPGAWPEPFGLAAVESLACGTPVVGRPAGALGEIVRDGIDGFLAADLAEMARAVDDVAVLDRSAIRRSVIERFSAARMADRYEAVYANVLVNPDGPLAATPATPLEAPTAVAPRDAAALPRASVSGAPVPDTAGALTGIPAREPPPPVADGER